MKQKFFTLVGLILISSIALLSSERLINKFSYLNNQEPAKNNPVIAIIKQAECLRKSMPKTGTVGYLATSEGPLLLHTDEARNDIRYFHLAQYTLTPIIIENNLEHEFIIGHLNDPNDLDTILTRFHLILIRKCYNAYYLFKRTDQ